VFKNSNGESGTINTDPNTEVIGCHYNTGLSAFFDGEIDEVKIWNRGLSADEVYQQYVSNLQKFNSTDWYLYVNQSLNSTDGLVDGIYTYSASAVDVAGNTNSTETRTITISASVPPTVTLTSPVDNSNFNTSTINFISNFTNLDLKNSTLYVWNSSLDLINQTDNTITGTTNSSNVSVVLAYDGDFTWNYYACDNLDNCAFGSSNFSLYVDTIYPNVSFAGQTPADGSSQSNTDVFVNVSSSDGGFNHSVVVDWNNSLVGWWRMDDRNASGDLIDISSHCYDNETEILTDEGWKLFKDLTKEEKVMTLNQETMELEYQMPYEWQEFDYNDDMFRVELEDGSDLLVSEEHKVYAGVEENTMNDLTILSIDPVMMVKIFEDDSVTFNLKSENKASNLSSFEVAHVMPEVFEIINSSFITTSNLTHLLLDCNKEGMVFSPENSQDLLQMFRRLRAECHSSSNHLSNSSGAIALECGPFSIFFNFSTNSFLRGSQSPGIQSIFSQNFHSPSERVPVLTYLSNSSFFMVSSLPTSDQFTQENLDILCLNDSFNGTVMHAIYSSPLACSFSNASSFFFNPCLNISGQLTSGRLSSLAFNSSGIENVVLIIFSIDNTSLAFLCECIDICGCIDVYKGIGSKPELEDFELREVKDVYSSFEEGLDIWFMDADNEPVKVKSIKKEKYTGKIYDVDVPNDVVLVRRKTSDTGRFKDGQGLNTENGSGLGNWKSLGANRALLGEFGEDWGSLEVSNSLDFDLAGAVWSGNSNNGTNVGATYTTAGKLGGQWSLMGLMIMLI